MADGGPSPGTNVFKRITTASTNLALIKGSAGNITDIITTPVATAMFLKLYDASATANVTVGTTVPALTIGLPAAGQVGVINFGGGGIRFMNGIVMAVTAAIADADSANSVASAGVVVCYN